jgi:hypothetical protein
MDDPSILRWAISLTLPALAGFAGIIVGAALSSRRERHARRLSFRSQQLQVLYGPLLGLRSEIQAISELRLRISHAADGAWRDLCERRGDYHTAAFQRLVDERGPQFDAIIEYDNRKLTEELIPTYRKMLETFRDNLWLAEPETVPHFARLVEFLDIWDRWLAKTLPAEVLDRLNHGEESLKPLYAHVEEIVRELRGWLTAGKAPARRSARL